MKSVPVRVIPVLALLIVSLSVSAEENRVSWTYLGALYQSGEIDSAGDLDFDGFRLEGSLGLGSLFHVKASWDQLDPDSVDDGMGGTISAPDIDIYGVGGGIHSRERSFSVGNVDGFRPKIPTYYTFFLDGEYLRSEAGSSDANGWAVDLGFRAVNFTRWEVAAAVGYEDFEDADGEFTVSGDILFKLFEHLQLQGGFDWNDEIYSFLVGVRVPF